MININELSDNFDLIVKKINSRGDDYSFKLKELVDLNNNRKDLIKIIEQTKAEKNLLTKKIGELIAKKEIDSLETNKGLVKNLQVEIEKNEILLNQVESNLKEKSAYIPNIPDESVPLGLDEQANVEVKKSSHKTLKVTDEKSAHYEIAEKLKLVDFKAGVKLSGSRFLIYTGLGAKLVRSIADVLLTRHVENGYKEIIAPLVVNQEMMFGTGQLPKFEEDAYKVEGRKYLIPTSEVSLTNIHRDEILDKKTLPIKYTSYSQCFRQESGSAGKDTKGMIRLHQFNKVELVKIVDPNSSMEELEKLVADAEDILKIFDLPYRIIVLCTGDMGFSAVKTYDLEVWYPSQNKYREISSCSNCKDFQARRMMIRYKADKANEYVHTLNGSGLAIDRLIGAILENYWDGEKLILPKVLRPYFNNEEYLKQ